MNPIQVDLQDFLRALVRGWITILACVLLGLGLSAAYLITQPVAYSASSQTYISISSAADPSTLTQGTAFAQDAAGDFAVIAGSPYVLNGVSKQLGITTSGAALAEQVTAEVLPNSSVIQITATADNASLASGLANATAVQLAQAVERLNPNVGNAASLARATQIAVAQTPGSPITPRVGLDLATGLAGGFALGVVVILIRELSNTRIRGVRQLERATERVVHGIVRAGPSDRGSMTEESAAVYRAVRTELLAGAVRNRLVVVANATTGRSSAAVSVDLARIIAGLGLNTLLLDLADRSASAERYFPTGSGAGLWDVLARNGSLPRLIVATDLEHLSYLPPGTTTEVAEDLVANADFVDTMEALSARYDVIVANADPVGDTTATRSLVQAMDGILLVAELDQTTIAEVRATSESIERSGGHLIGTILVERDLERAALRHPSRHGA